MRAGLIRCMLGMLLLAATATQALAQPPIAPYSGQTPSRLPATDEVTPVPSDDSGWPVEEILPSQTLPEPILPDPAAEVLIVDEPMPLEEATRHWYDPRWMFPGKVSGGFELGLNGSDGNSEAFSMKTGFNFKHKTDWDEFAVDLAYNKATADGAQTQHNAQFNASYERSIKDSKWSLFLKDSTLYDEFKPYDLRVALNGGVSYTAIKTEATTWKVRFGAGGSVEIGGVSESWIPEGVLGTDFDKQLTDRQKISLTSDFFPDWRDASNYRVVTKASYEVLLDEVHNLNLKLSLNDQYDSTPNGAKPNDIFYSIVLLWKM